MKLKTYLLPGVFSLEFLIRPENLAVGGGVSVRRGAAGESLAPKIWMNLLFLFFWHSCLCIVALKLSGANAACAEDCLCFCI